MKMISAGNPKRQNTASKSADDPRISAKKRTPQIIKKQAVKTACFFIFALTTYKTDDIIAI